MNRKTQNYRNLIQWEKISRSQWLSPQRGSSTEKSLLLALHSLTRLCYVYVTEQNNENWGQAAGRPAGSDPGGQRLKPNPQHGKGFRGGGVGSPCQCWASPFPSVLWKGHTSDKEGSKQLLTEMSIAIVE